MIFENARLTSTESTGINIELHPDWSLSHTILQNIHTHRAVSGRIYTYRQENSRGFQTSLPVEFVADSDAQLIREWWEAGKVLKLTTADSSTEPNTYNGRIVNRENPFPMRNFFQNDKWQGVLMFKSTKADAPLALNGVFTLDDAFFGQLDLNFLG